MGNDGDIINLLDPDGTGTGDDWALDSVTGDFATYVFGAGTATAIIEVGTVGDASIDVMIDGVLDYTNGAEV